MARAKLTIKHLEGLKKSHERQLISDSEPGLWVEVRPSPRGETTITYQARYRNELGKQRTFRLGAHPQMGLADARAAAMAVRAAVDRGEDPADEKATQRAARATRATKTFERIAEGYLSEARLQGKRPRTLAEYERIIRNHLAPRIGALPVQDLDREDFRNLRDELVRAYGIFAANGALRLARATMNFAAGEGQITAVPSFKKLLVDTPNRERRWTDRELAAIWTAAETLRAPWSQYVRLLILTGLRRSELACARWEHLERSRLALPAESTKGGRRHVVPLVRTAVDALAELPLGGGDYIFSSAAGTKPISGFSKLKAYLEQKLEYPIANFRLHDCRHNVSSFLADRGWPESERASVLGHASGTVTSVYTHSDAISTKLRALSQWESHVLQVLGRATGNVVALEFGAGA